MGLTLLGFGLLLSGGLSLWPTWLASQVDPWPGDADKETAEIFPIPDGRRITGADGFGYGQVVLFLGPDFASRENGAHNLWDQGLAPCLSRPAWGVISCRFDPAGQTFYKVEPPPWPRGYGWPIQATLVELAIAKTGLDRLGQNSAIMVSSPWHMARIRLWAGRLFAPGTRLVFTAPPDIDLPPWWWWLRPGRYGFLYDELIKYAATLVAPDPWGNHPKS